MSGGAIRPEIAAAYGAATAPLKTLNGNGAADQTSAPRPNQASTLVQLAAAADLFHGPDGTSYATVSVDAHRETHLLRSRALRSWLAQRYYAAERRTPSSQAVQDALGVLEGRALYGAPERAVAVRVADHEGAIFLDLGGPTWEAVKVTADGWEIVTEPAVRFRRPRGMLALPTPQRGGSINDLRALANLETEADLQLISAWLVAALRPVGPYPVLVLAGEQGSAKSSTARMVRDLVDPCVGGLRAEPRSVHDLVIAARNGWIVGLDNLSTLEPWLSDALCRLATGGGFATRELYTDTEEIIFDGQRPALLTGISDVATRPDLLDRAIVLTLPPIAEAHRRSEAELRAAYESARPRILGALLDAVAVALRRLPDVRLERLPRMADFAVWATAAEPALGWPAGAILAAYDAGRQVGNETALEASPVGTALLRLMTDRPSWAGTAAELLEELAGRDQPAARGRSWPGSARALSGALRRLAPVLRAVGFEVRWTRTRSARTVSIESTANTPSQPSPSSPTVESGRDGRDAVPARDRIDRHNHSTIAPSLRDAGDGRDACDGVPAHSDGELY